jgi:hypothetical protein
MQAGKHCGALATVREPVVVRFLRHLLRHTGERLLVVWDGLPAHRGKVVKQFLS